MFQILGLVLLLGQPGQAPQGHLMDAKEVLRELTKTLVPTVSSSKLPLDIGSFNSRSDGMSLADAADGWLKLVDETDAEPRNPDSLSSSRFKAIEALPRPEAWPLIQDRLAKRGNDFHTRALRLLFDTLLGNERGVVLDCEALRQSAPEQSKYSLRPLSMIEEPAAVATGDLEVLGKLFNLQAVSTELSYGSGLPDLVGMFGPERARKMIKGILEAAAQQLGQVDGSDTKRLARFVMIEDIANIKKPQWSLAEGPDRAEYVSKLVAKFGVDSLNDGGGSAKLIYGLSLLKAGKMDEGGAFFAKDQIDRYDQDYSFTDFGGAVRVFDLLSQLLDRYPDSRVWTLYTPLGEELGKQMEIGSRLDQLLHKQGVAKASIAEFIIQKGDLAAAAGDIHGAVVSYLEALRALPGFDPSLPYRDDDQHVFGKLAKLAWASGYREATDAALQIAQQSNLGVSIYDDTILTPALLSQNRISDAQALIVRETLSAGSGQRSLAEMIVPSRLAEYYYLTNRPSDIVELIDGFPVWPSDDLHNELLRTSAFGWGGPPATPTMGFYAAWAFSKTGRKELAIRTLHDLLSNDLSQDDAYDLLNQLEGEPALALYDDLINNDRWAPRPVSWKADLLRRLGRLEAAEALARKAVALDPSDGEMTAEGHRLMSCTILARILWARGKVVEAERYEALVKAVRLGEKGDEYRSAGLFPQALAQYEESSKVFPGLYFVQLSMAFDLEHMGKHAEAIKHVQRAYELMPDGVGKVVPEFLATAPNIMYEQRLLNSDERQTAIAELTKRIADEQGPSSSQANYLLGQLHEESDSKAAFIAYERAVHIDPDNLSAWAAILGHRGAAPWDLEARASLRVAALDPMHLHTGYYTGYSGDYRKLWRTYDTAAARLPISPSGPLYPLRNSPPLAAVAASIMGDDSWSPGWVFADNGVGPAKAALRDGPGAALAADPVIAAICALYSGQ